MKVSEAIKMLTQNYKQDDELFIAWWDKDLARDYANEGDELSDQQWASIINTLDEDEYLFFAVASTISQLINNREVIQ